MPRPTVRDVHQDAALSQISIAYRNPEYIAMQVFPRVTVEKQSDYYYIFDRGAWFRVADSAQRAPGTRAKRIDYTLSTGSYLCKEYSLAEGVPDEQRANADNPLNPEQDAVAHVTDSLYRLHEKRVADLVLTNGSTNWANSASPTTQWNNSTSDPVGDVETARFTVAGAIGMFPNTLVMGANVWKALKQHPDLLDRIKYTERGVLTTEIAAGIFEVDRILVGKSSYDSANEGETASMSFLWGKVAALIYVPSNPGLRQPAAGYTFEWMPFATERYREDQEKTDVFAVSHNVTEVICGSDAGYAIYKAVA